MTKKEQEELKKQNSLYKKVKEASDKKTEEIRFWERRAEHWGRLKADKDRELDKMAVELRHSQALCALLLEKLGGKSGDTRLCMAGLHRKRCRGDRPD